jgi:hypothetical protein
VLASPRIRKLHADPIEYQLDALREQRRRELATYRGVDRNHQAYVGLGAQLGVGDGRYGRDWPPQGSATDASAPSCS